MSQKTSETEMIDKLFLELSQFTTAKTHREVAAAALVKTLGDYPHPK